MYQQCKKQERKLYIQNIDEDTPQQQKYFHCIIQVQDAIIYYDSGYMEKKESRNLYCEIDLICITEDFYEEVKPGERLIIQGLKTRTQEFRAKYDHEKEDFNKKCLFLQTIPNQSKILLYKNQAKKEEISDIKAFGQKIVDQMPIYTFTDFQQNQALMENKN
ncbi:hypothetical protein PPERSA_11779 [Pseudocohnilembus persalinus]|uniref:Uncharacterized protein n=1 Tax=Pseudocohnilembus persalinus TaxID=266149 RepID=A0A0V0QGR1_PSEPJ|nr:hypothetical protein PPERSA_11779 [Pseudocohnilembus persalinus]|eukprot:KRX01332.1 hypothetical protein PPERSA_11779 [Pseudocohnilembus persalinus]